MTELSRSPGSLASELASRRSEALRVIIDCVTPIRASFITPLPGQEMLYLRKEREALAFLAADPEPSDLQPFPFIAAEVGITAATAAEVAQTYTDQAGAWAMFGAALETVRLRAVAAVELAADGAEIAAALVAFHSELETFR